MKLNHYLKDLGFKWEDLPGNYISRNSLKVRLQHRWYKIKRGFCFAFSAFEDKAPDFDEFYESNAFDPRNKEDEEGFCDTEFWSLDYSMAMYIYPRLCEFREHYAKYGTPGCFCYDEEGNHIDNGNEKWLETLDKMILAFKYILREPDFENNDQWTLINTQVDEGLHLFAEYYRGLWY